MLWWQMWQLLMVLGILWIVGKKELRPQRWNRLPYTSAVRTHLKELFADGTLGRDAEDLHTAKDWTKMMAYCHSRVVGTQHSVIPCFHASNFV